jgi:hypothetical protein
MDLKPDVYFPLEKSLWQPEKKIRFELLDHHEENELLSSKAVSLLTQQIPLDTNRLRSNIADMFREKSDVTLPELLECFPAQGGLAELVAYVVIARENEKNEVNDREKEQVRIRLCDPLGIPTDLEKDVEVPKVVFRL